jgi:hypothetical protein
MYNRSKHDHIEDPAATAKKDTISPGTGKPIRVTICGEDEGYLTYFKEPENAGCSKCINAYDLGLWSDYMTRLGRPDDEDLLVLTNPVKYAKTEYRDFKSNTPLLNKDGEIVGFIRLDNGWGKKDWHIAQHHVFPNGEWASDDDRKPMLGTTILKGGYRSKWEALLAANDTYRGTLLTEAEAWTWYEDKKVADNIRENKREAKRRVEKADLDRQIAALDDLVENAHKAIEFGLSNVQIEALTVAVELLKEARDNV